MTNREASLVGAAGPAALVRRLRAFVDRHQAIAVGLLLTAVIYVGVFPTLFPVDNQNTYLLNGLAASGYGHLSEDWMSNTKTPFAVFSAIIAALNRLGFLEGIHVVGFLLTAVFSASCLILFSNLRPDLNLGRRGRVLFVLLIAVIAIHDRFMLGGMAGQYALGMYVQPSEFGVLLIVSTALFVARRTISPYVCAALAGVFHQSYLLSGAFLVIGFLSYEVMFGGRVKTALIGSFIALAITCPILWYSYAAFSPSDAETFAYSRTILAEYRFPHHADPARWFDRSQVLKIVVLLLATVLSFFISRRLAYVMALTAALGTIASIAAVLVDSNALYLLFPWRISTVLMPLAAIVMAIGVVRIVVDSRLGGVVTGWKAAAVMIAIAIAMAGNSFSDRLAASTVHRTGEPAVGAMFQDREAEYRELIRFVRGEAARGRVFLHEPTRYFSFRIRSGMPTYVDFKSHPYRDDEVVEWWQRLTWARDVFSGRRACVPALHHEMGDRGITHVIVDNIRDGIDSDSMADCVGGGGPDSIVFDNGLYSVVQVGS